MLTLLLYFYYLRGFHHRILLDFYHIPSGVVSACLCFLPAAIRYRPVLRGFRLRGTGLRLVVRQPCRSMTGTSPVDLHLLPPHTLPHHIPLACLRTK